MNIFLHELKAYRKSTIIWSLSMYGLAIMYILIFKGLGEDIEAFRVFISNLPDMAKKLFNIYLDSISTLEGFYSIVLPFVLLCGAIQAMNLGISILSKEVRDKTADFLMTKPVSRVLVLSAKIFAAFSLLLVTNIIYLVLTVTSTTAIVAEYNVKLFLMLSLTLFFVQLIFMFLGIIISVMAGKIKSVISISLSTVFGFYIIGSLGSVIGEDKARYISPFRYFDAGYIIRNAAYETSYIIVGCVFIIAAIAGSYLIYKKKDIHAV
ncbi:MAG: ABC-2 family transporter protein [Firmicutes bacterium ADurb.Bin419]|nr:MAG: ABC-2 family transporter protein [Firmicutes bacterium ADurb.Bin419]